MPPVQDTIARIDQLLASGGLPCYEILKMARDKDRFDVIAVLAQETAR